MPLQQTRVDVFEDIFLVFLGLGTLVGVVVISYVLYNAYKYRDDGEAKDDESLPTLGELPTGGKGGKKLFLSFGISAVIVISLVIWTYGMLLYVEDPQDEFDEEPVEIEVTGESFAWHFEYANGVEASSTMRIPADKPVAIQTTSGDVWHTFGIPDLRVKADAIPGEYDETWFMADEAGAEHEIKCFELCGESHTAMVGNVQVMEEEAFNEWLNGQLTLDVEIVDQNEEPVTEGYEMTLEHTQNDQYEEDLVHTYTAEDFDENGTISLDHEDLQQGGEYNVTITFEDDQYETVEETIEIDGPSSETFTVGSADEADNGNGTNESDDGGDGE
ncbi:cytochrome c oxidase subunit II [Haloterrigena sp. SYSU A558-1]|uniref:Cytochrome c oxidase subunit II n=1 Tax=Haloterrigena gelatinilytica TaxID=2741724 RepID=A0A8J8GMT5_9EURY|nr:cytochrome c oxidase subunit II [Haloterrigena gelatinilytica]NUB92526.1 cytochrome c oxidase subunit II [Haloterrigena gelatinilytica]NUC71557.1 cytochrome c oxidase subunit II [Haloterrigena gelatinilytica]